jgi:hypothetical protein
MPTASGLRLIYLQEQQSFSGYQVWLQADAIMLVLEIRDSIPHNGSL